jgi:hypothetical protein
MENVISVFLIEMVFSMKLTPVPVSKSRDEAQGVLTQRLDVILVPAALDIFHHQAGLSDLRVSHHTDLDDDAGVLACSLWWSLLLLLLRAPGLVLV